MDGAFRRGGEIEPGQVGAGRTVAPAAAAAAAITSSFSSSFFFFGCCCDWDSLSAFSRFIMDGPLHRTNVAATTKQIIYK